jgi:hypothetical protein
MKFEIKNTIPKPDMVVVHTFNIITQRLKQGGHESEASLDFIDCLKSKTKQKKEQNKQNPQKNHISFILTSHLPTRNT